MKSFDKIIIVILVIWTFLHTWIFIKGQHYIREVEQSRLFYPFTYESSGDHVYSYSFNFEYYDKEELFIYVGSAWLLFWAYKFLSKGSKKNKSHVQE
jgi:hypothetical protein